MKHLGSFIGLVLFLVGAVLGAIAFGGILIGVLAIAALVAGFTAVIVWVKVALKV